MWKRLLGSMDPLTTNKVRLFEKSLSTPMLAWSGVRIVEDSNTRSEFLVPLTWRTKNSWGTVFFAAIATGIDITGGWAAFDISEKSGVGILYKDMNIRFLRRVDSDLSLVCTDVGKIREAAAEAARTGERINVPVQVLGYCYEYRRDSPVVAADLTLSLKKL